MKLKVLSENATWGGSSLTGERKFWDDNWLNTASSPQDGVDDLKSYEEFIDFYGNTKEVPDWFIEKVIKQTGKRIGKDSQMVKSAFQETVINRRRKMFHTLKVNLKRFRELSSVYAKSKDGSVRELAR